MRSFRRILSEACVAGFIPLACVAVCWSVWVIIYTARMFVAIVREGPEYEIGSVHPPAFPPNLVYLTFQLVPYVCFVSLFIQVLHNPAIRIYAYFGHVWILSLWSTLCIDIGLSAVEPYRYFGRAWLFIGVWGMSSVILVAKFVEYMLSIMPDRSLFEWAAALDSFIDGDEIMDACDDRCNNMKYGVLLYGITHDGKSWFQLERYPLCTPGHLFTYLYYKLCGRNTGPAGTTNLTESEPFLI